MLRYGWELTDSERRREWYSVIKLGKDVATQTNLLKRQSKEMIAAQADSANAIITSQDSIRGDIESLAYRIEDGMDGLRAAFEFGISEVVWQIEQNRQVLKDILEILMAPLDTQAKELRSRAEEAYANGWVEDALEDFLESEKKNKYDFSVHISIGMINLFQTENKEKALEYFERAVKYAKPKSPYHASFALLHAAVIKWDSNLIADAEKLTNEAIELSPIFAEALYQNAQYNAQLKNVQKSLSNLKRAIKIDRNYCLKANNDKMFDPIRSDLNKLFETLREEAKQACLSSCKTVLAAISKVNDIVLNHEATFGKLSVATKDYSTPMTTVNNLIERNSYFDTLNAHATVLILLRESAQYIATAHKLINNNLNKLLSRNESVARNLPKNREWAIQAQRSKISDSTNLGCLTWAVLYFGWAPLVFLAMKSGNKALAVIFNLGNVILLFGGWWIGKALLRYLARQKYPSENFSQFFAENQKKEDELKEYQAAINTSLSGLKENLQQIMA